MPKPESRIALFAVFLALAGCGQGSAPPAETAETTAETYDLRAQFEKMASVRMDPETGYLTEEERDVVNLLLQASELLDPVYLRQRGRDLPAVRERIAADTSGDRKLLLDMFDAHSGPWDQLADHRPFYGDRQMPPGAGFYPEDLTREEFEAYLEANPGQAPGLTSPYTVVKRDGDRLVAVPYSEEYAQWLRPAAELLRRAAARTSNPSLKKFLALRADSFLTNRYLESELAWLDVKDTPIEIAIGPYEPYIDRLYGTKTAFESFVTLKNPRTSALLATYKSHLRDMEANLPIGNEFKDLNRKIDSPITVADRIGGGGEANAGAQAVAFNLPNDPRVRAEKGSRHVILTNVLRGKFDRILSPMGDVVLDADQAGLVMMKYMETEAIFYEFGHSIAPKNIVVDGERTTVEEALGDQFRVMRVATSKVMSAYNIEYMMERGVLPASERPQHYATYFTGLFRSMRFGTEVVSGKAAALQYGFLKEKGAFTWDDEDKRYTIDPDRMDAAIKDLLRVQLQLLASGDREGTRSLFERYAKIDNAARSRIEAMKRIPLDIRPIYPDGV